MDGGVALYVHPGRQKQVIWSILGRDSGERNSCLLTLQPNTMITKTYLTSPVTRRDVLNELVEGAVDANVQRSEQIAFCRGAACRIVTKDPGILMNRGAIAWKTVEGRPIAPKGAVLSIQPTDLEAVVNDRPVKIVSALAPSKADNNTSLSEPV